MDGMDTYPLSANVVEPAIVQPLYALRGTPGQRVTGGRAVRPHAERASGAAEGEAKR